MDNLKRAIDEYVWGIKGSSDSVTSSENLAGVGMTEASSINPYLWDVVFERLPRPDGYFGEWEPTIPSSDPENAGIDLSSAIFVEAEKLSSGIYAAVVRTGVRVKLPTDIHMRIASRSGLGFFRNIFAFPGTIDSGYRGEIMIKLFQLGASEPFYIEPRERIAQAILFSTPRARVVEGEVPTSTERGVRGFGSSGR